MSTITKFHPALWTQYIKYICVQNSLREFGACLAESEPEGKEDHIELLKPSKCMHDFLSLFIPLQTLVHLLGVKK